MIARFRRAIASVWDFLRAFSVTDDIWNELDRDSGPRPTPNITRFPTEKLS